MVIHVFTGKSCFGFTPQEDGSNLPDEFGPWQKFKVLPDVKEGQKGRIATSDDEILQGIEENGYYVQTGN